MEEKGKTKEVETKIIYENGIMQIKQRFAGNFYEAQEGFLFN